VPDSITAFVSAETVVFLNACFELIFAVLLGLGIFTRISALLLGLHLLGITIHVGFNPTGARDFGLALATLVIAMFGSDSLCLETKCKKK
ncbi:MAG TPA: DoxX family membrane protein, partial [Allocoleopsis sp.]